MARTKLTPERQERIVTLLRAGNYCVVAAEASGIREQTFFAWIERGEADAEAGKDTIFAAFAEETKKARHEAEAMHLARIARAAIGTDDQPAQWQASAWILERTHPDRYSRRERHEVTGRGGGPIQVNSPTNDDRRAEVARILAEAGAT